MIDAFWGDLKSGSENRRRNGWRALQTALMEEQFGLTHRDILRLLDRLREETEPNVQQAGLEALLSSALLRDRHAADGRHSGLARWFWSPVKLPTAVFRAIEVDRRRDEDAVIELARSLPHRDFRNTVFLSVPLEDPRWQERLDFPKSCCFVGRLEIFGDEAIREFGSDALRFYFPRKDRPPRLKPGALDPKRYHRIHQRRNDRDVGRPLLSAEEGGRRTDYALVQRYYQPQKQRTVVLFAGSSTLGTLGAVIWAVSLQDQQIPLPKNGLREHDRLEALIEVSAPVVEHPWQWQPETPRLLRLIAGNRLEWYESRREWGRPPTDLILIKRDSRIRAAGVFANEVSGTPTFREGSEMFQFIDLLYKATEGRPGRTVKSRDNLWEKVTTNPTLRKRLRESLPEAISVDPPQVTLHVPVEEC